jgi:hypothetical protein
LAADSQNQAITTTTLLQFRNDSGLLPTRLGKPGVLPLYMDKAPKPVRTEQGLLISVRSAVNARAAPPAHKTSRSVRQRLPIGTARSRGAPCAESPCAESPCTESHCTESHCTESHCTESHRAQHHWSPTGWTLSPNTAGNQARMQPAFLQWLRDQPKKRPLGPKTPQEGRPGRNDSTCAGIRR